MRRLNLFADFELEILITGVLPIFELDNTHFFETMTQPEVIAIKQPELLAVRHDLGEQHLLKYFASWVVN